MILEELNKEGQIIRKAYQRRLPSNPSKDYYFMHRNTGNNESIIVEYGFIDNEKDANKLKNNYKDYADAVVRAVLNYIGYNVNNDNIYIVKSGDSLYSIAKKNNTTVMEIKSLNNLQNNFLVVGQKLILPEIKETNEYTIYTVKQGDSLYSIAKKYNITVDDIIDYNGLDSKIITVNQNLLIPTNLTNDNYINYIVEPGDNLYSIAKKNNITVDKLKDINNLYSDILIVGQSLLIPKSNSKNDFNEYIVKSGDSLYSIAKKFNTSVKQIIDINNINENILMIGQKLYIPINEQKTYMVKNGDSLYSIAKKNNISVDELKQKNNLETNLLKIGQILVL